MTHPKLLFLLGQFLLVQSYAQSWVYQCCSDNPWLMSLSCVNSSYCVAGGAASTTSREGAITKMADGKNWETKKTGFPDFIRSVLFTTKDTGYAVGSGGIIRTTDSGNTWIQQKPIVQVWSIACINSKKCVAVGRNFTLTTSDAGENWKGFQTGNNTPQIIKCLDTTGYYGVGGFINNIGGQGFFKSSRIPNDSIIWVLKLWTTSALEAVHFPNPKIGYAVGWNVDSGSIKQRGIIYKTLDSGNTWVEQKPGIRSGEPLTSIFCIDSSNCFAGGLSLTMGITKNGGESWETLATSMDSFQKGSSVNSIACPSRDSCFAVGSLSQPPYSRGLILRFDPITVSIRPVLKLFKLKWELGGKPVDIKGRSLSKDESSEGKIHLN